MARISVPTDRLEELDLLRFMAASMVVAYHWTDLSILPLAGDAFKQGLQSIAVYGYLGVDLFFLISGFVIAGSATRQTPVTFFSNRLSRLYPSFWLSIIAMLALSAFVVGADGRVHLTATLANATLWPKLFGFPFLDDVYWTLVVELKFYLLTGIAVLLAPRYSLEQLARFWLLFVLVSFASGHLTANSAIDNTLKFATLFPFGPLFIAGMTFFYIWQDRPTGSRVCTLALCLLVAMIASAERAPTFIRDATLGSQLVAAFGTLMCFATISSLALGWWQLPWKRSMLALGGYSYPIYLVHNKMAQMIWDSTTGPQELRFGIVVTSTAALVALITFASERKATPVFKRALVSVLRRALFLDARSNRRLQAGRPDTV